MMLEVENRERWLILRALRRLGNDDNNVKLAIEATDLLERLIDDYD